MHESQVTGIALEQPLPVSHAPTNGQLADVPHEPDALQSTSHAHEVSQVIPPSHESAAQVTPQRPVPQVIGPLHD